MEPKLKLARLNKQPHRCQLGSKMIKRERDNMGWAKDMGAIGQRKEKNTKEKPLKNNAKHENEQKQTKAL